MGGRVIGGRIHFWRAERAGIVPTNRHRMQQRRSRTTFGLLATPYFAALTLLFFRDALFDPQWVISGPLMDIEQYFLPIRGFIIDEIFGGNIPLWNPFHLGGIPAFANFQYAMLYPLNWLHLGLPVEVALDWVVAIHVMLSGLFTAAWCRSRGTSTVGSLLGGTIFMLGGPITMHVYAGYVTYLCVVAWTPLLFMCADAIVENRRPGRAALRGAAIVAMQVLAGYPQPVYFSGVAVVFYAIIRLINVPGAFASLARIALMFFLGAGLSAIQLLPGIDAALESNRGGNSRFAFSTSFSFAPENLLTLIMPHPLGDGFHTQVFNRWGNVDTSVFMGVAGTMLAFLAICCTRSKRDAAIIATIVIALFIALGKYNPLYRPLWMILPGLEQMRFPSRAIFVIALLGSVLAANGFDQLWRIRALKRTAIIAGVLAMGLLAAGLIFRATASKAADGPWGRFITNLVLTGETFFKLDKPDAASQLQISALFASTQFLTAAGAMGVLTIVLLLLRRQTNWAYLIPILVMIELWPGAGHAWLRFLLLPPPPAWQPAFVKIDRDDRVVVMSPNQQNLTIPLRFESVNGYDPAVLARWDALVGPMLGSEVRTGNLEMRRLRPNVRWDMLRLGVTLPDHPDIPLNPVPRVTLLDSAIVVPGPEESLLAVREQDFDPRKAVVLETSPNPSPERGDIPIGSAEVISVTTDDMEIVADISRPAILLVTDGYSSGWKASSQSPGSQQSYDVLPANHGLRAIPLAAGKHHILLEYRPRAIAIGMTTTAIAALLWIVTWIVLFIPRKSRAPLAG